MNAERRDDRITLRFIAARGEVSSSGTNVAAGRMLEWIDRAGYACAVGWSGSYCVTAYVGNVNYTRPVRPGRLVEARARIIHTGRTSMHVLVTVATSEMASREFEVAGHCILVFVAIDDNGKSRPVEPWLPRTSSDVALQRHAEERIAPRIAIADEMDRVVYSGAGTAPRTKFRFLAAPADANWGGNAHGGTVMRWIDEAAFACAAAWSSSSGVAVYSGGIQFYRPIHIGHIVEVESRLIRVTRRSMHITTHVRSAPATAPRDLALTTRCVTIYVDPGPAGGSAKELRPLLAVSDEDHQLESHAVVLTSLRRQMPTIEIELLDPSDTSR